MVNISSKALKERNIKGFEEWKQDPNHLYIGRWTYPTKQASKWANPFSVKKYGREECIKKFEQHIRSKPQLWNALDELKGKELGCWCKPDGCHGDVLIKLLNEKEATCHCNQDKCCIEAFPQVAQ